MSVDEELANSLGLVPGAVIGGKYRVETLLAAGGMGAVFKAHHEILDKPVAIKVIRPELASRKEISQRFLREARAAAKIASDYVARVTDVDLVDDKTPYMVMEFLEGEDLHALMDAQPKFPIAQAVDYALQALLGLEAAHANGVVHRDLKPSNLFVEKRGGGGRRVKILDFGISKVVGNSEDDSLKAGATTSAGQMLGTPRYMSPEQVASAKNVDARTDLWSLGLILYEMLTGQFPFDGTSAGTILASILTNPIAPLTDLRPEAPIELEEALQRALAKERDARYANAGEMIRGLAPFGSKRMQAVVAEHEHEDPAAEGPATRPMPASGQPTKADSPMPLRNRPATPSGASLDTPPGPATPSKAGPRGASVAMRATELAESVPGTTPPSDGKQAVSSSPESSGVPPAGRSTTWMLVVGATLAFGIGVAVYFGARGPSSGVASGASSTTTSATSAPSETAARASASPPGTPTISLGSRAEPQATEVPSASSAPSASAATTVARPAIPVAPPPNGFRPPPPQPTAPATAPTSSNGLIRSRD